MENLTLLTQVKLGAYSLQNRIAMAPMTRCRAIGNVANSLMAEYYAQRASVGLIITEGVAPSANGLGYARIPGIYSQAQVESWKQVTAAVHAKGGKIFMQLMHTGRVSHIANMPEGAVVLAPSAVAAQGKMWTDSQAMQDNSAPEEMTLAQIAETIAEYAQAAKNAIEAGFDGVELHAASGYLPNQFLSTNANLRTDNYGGSIENRARFVLETLAAMTAVVGSERVGIKLSPGMNFNDILVSDTAEMFSYLAKNIPTDLAYLHVMRIPGYAEFDVVETFRSLYTGTLMFGCGFDKETGEALLATGKADLVVYGNLMIANPDLPTRFAKNEALQQAKNSTFYTPDAKGYTDYPTLN